MNSRYSVALNGVEMASIHQDLYIADIRYNNEQKNDVTFPSANRQGAVYMKNVLAPKVITIVFRLYIYDINLRQTICQAVNKWAMNGGILTTNDRAGQKLSVVPGQNAVIPSAMKWTDDLTISFTAPFPYWEQSAAATVTIADSAVHDLLIPGNVPQAEQGALVDATATLTASTDTLAIRCDSNVITLNSLAGTTGDVIRFYHDDNRFLHIEKNGTSILGKRSGADDLTAKSGGTSIFMVTGPASVVFEVRGLWR